MRVSMCVGVRVECNHGLACGWSCMMKCRAKLGFSAPRVVSPRAAVPPLNSESALHLARSRAELWRSRGAMRVDGLGWAQVQIKEQYSPKKGREKNIKWEDLMV